MVIITRDQLPQKDNGNIYLSNIEKIVKEAFMVDGHVRIEGEDRVYYEDAFDELICHIQDLLDETEQ